MSNFHPMKPREPGTIWDAISAAFDQVGGIPKVAKELHRKPWWAYTVSDEDASAKARTSLSYADACTVAKMGGTALAEHIALAAGGVFLPVASAASPAAVQDAIASASRETGEAISAAILAVAAAGGCERARAEATREVREGIRALTSMLAALEGEPNIVPFASAGGRS